LDAKRFEILGELAPAAKVVGALINPNRPGVEIQEQELRAAAKAADRDLVVLRPGDSHALEAAFATLAERKITVLLVGADAFFNNHRPQIVARFIRGASSLPRAVS
jgi:putative ABC transport system substrate-binding protein